MPEANDDSKEMWSVEDLVANMQDRNDDPGSRALFARALGERGPEAKSAVPALIEALSENHSALQMEAADALGKMGDAAVTAVPALEHMKHSGSSPGVRTAAADAVIAITNPAEYQRVQHQRRKSGLVVLALSAIALLLVICFIVAAIRRFL